MATHDHQWRLLLQAFLSRLHALSAHRLSVLFYVVASGVLFLTVLFVALPSARIRVWPSVAAVSHTSNVLLVLSGAHVDTGKHQVLSLIPIRITVRRAITFDQISKHFTGENAEVEMTIVNEGDEAYSLRKGTRLVNQAGMIFRLRESVVVPAASVIEPGVVRVQARAAPEDLYGQIVGERGNIPAGLKWEIPGLMLEERKFVFARNNEEAAGGRTEYGVRLREEDLDLARKQLEQELIQAAKVGTEEEIALLTARTGKEHVILQYDVLTEMAFDSVVLPSELIGEPVQSIPVESALRYNVLAYSKDDLLDLLYPGLQKHIEEGYDLIPESVMKEGISVHVIEYDDDLQWVKITAELTGKQHAVLSPSTPFGRDFGLKLREAIKGRTVADAERVIQNFPEVQRVDIAVWPPWRAVIPSLTSNISLVSGE